jgi:GxxExxY protein
MLHKEVTEAVIKSFYKVYNTLGYGFLEKVYENALAIELQKAGLQCQQQQQIIVYYEHQEIGLYFADLVVENCVVIELKTVEALTSNHEYQLLNYLKATEIEIGLLLNFGQYPQIVRKIYTNNRKNWLPKSI